MPEIAMFGKHFFRRFWQALVALRRPALRREVPRPLSAPREASADYGAATLYEDINVGEKSSAEMQQRYTIATAVDGVNRWENRRAQTKAAIQFARAPCEDVADAAGQIPIGRNRARGSQCGRRANGKSVFHQT